MYQLFGRILPPCSRYNRVADIYFEEWISFVAHITDLLSLKRKVLTTCVVTFHNFALCP
jgi:hypothetical protein